MPITGSKQFSLLSSALETLADGIQRHASDPGFPSLLSEQEIRDVRKSLEAARETYEKLQAQADQAHEAYAALLKAAKDKVANAQRMLQGAYGLRSEVLKDFGFQPPKPGGRRGPREKGGQ